MGKTEFSPWDSEYLRAGPAPVYDELWLRLETALKQSDVETVLDFGCGDGNYSILMKKMGLQVTGIDASLNAVNLAKRLHQGANVKFYNGDAIPDHCPDQSIDALVMLNVLHCLTREQRTSLLCQAQRVLTHGGLLFASLLSTNDRSYPRNEWQEIEPNIYDDGSGKLFHFSTLADVLREFDRFTVQSTDLLENVHPESGRKSSLHIVMAIKS